MTELTTSKKTNGWLAAIFCSLWLALGILAAAHYFERSADRQEAVELIKEHALAAETQRANHFQQQFDGAHREVLRLTEQLHRQPEIIIERMPPAPPHDHGAEWLKDAFLKGQLACR